MNDDDVENIFEKIQGFLKDRLWYEFDVMSFDGKSLTIYGVIDRTYHHAIELIFADVFYVSAIMAWTWDRSENPKVLELVCGEEAKGINEKYSVERGYKIFRFNAEGVEDGCVVVARNLSLKII